MIVHVLFFAQARERAGCSSATLELEAGSRIADVLDLAERRYPALAALRPHLAVAMERRLVAADTPVTEGAEIALLPPVSGG